MVSHSTLNIGTLCLGMSFLLRLLFANKLQFANMCEKVLKITETRINHVFKAIIIPKCC